MIFTPVVNDFNGLRSRTRKNNCLWCLSRKIMLECHVESFIVAMRWHVFDWRIRSAGMRWRILKRNVYIACSHSHALLNELNSVKTKINHANHTLYLRLFFFFIFIQSTFDHGPKKMLLIVCRVCELLDAPGCCGCLRWLDLFEGVSADWKMSGLRLRSGGCCWRRPGELRRPKNNGSAMSTWRMAIRDGRSTLITSGWLKSRTADSGTSVITME